MDLNWKKIKKELNLRVIQRLYTDIIKIKNISHQCSLYEMVEENEDWQFSQIQGPLFICKNNVSKLKSLLILNQNSKTNFYVQINKWLLENDDNSFMIYFKNEQNKVMCLSFFNEKEYKKVQSYLNKIIV